MASETPESDGANGPTPPRTLSIELPGARLTRMECLEVIAVAGLPGEYTAPNEFYDTVEDMWPWLRQEHGGAFREIGGILFDQDEVDMQDELDRAIDDLYYSSDLETEAFMKTSDMATLRKLSRKLLTRMLEQQPANSAEVDAWHVACTRMAKTLADFPETAP